MVMEQPRMKQVLPEKKWGSIESLNALEALNHRVREDVYTIFLDAKGNEPEVLRVSGDVFVNKVRLCIDSKTISDFKSLLGTIMIKSDPELMTCLRKSEIDRKAGKYRKFEEIARECGI